QLDVFAGAKFAPFSDAHNGSESPRPLILSPVDVLNNAYTNIVKHGISPNTILEAMPKDEKDRVEGWLHSFYDAGNNVNQNVARSVIQGFRNGNFSIDGNGAFALVAFLDGA
ncbi:chromosome partitioning protein ParB, partial [Xylella fastidiosa subsp. multiplex]|nr:chromosome partitioning protein ParB [Xylella fastidiosa subsp. multiplex]